MLAPPSSGSYDWANDIVAIASAKPAPKPAPKRVSLGNSEPWVKEIDVVLALFGVPSRGMSALGQKQTCAVHQPMSALPPKADIIAIGRGLQANAFAQKFLRTVNLLTGLCRCQRDDPVSGGRCRRLSCVED